MGECSCENKMGKSSSGGRIGGGDKGEKKDKKSGDDKKQFKGNSGMKNGEVSFDKKKSDNDKKKSDKGDKKKSDKGDSSAVHKRADNDDSSSGEGSSGGDGSSNVPGGAQSANGAEGSGDEVHVDETIVVGSGEVFDGQGKTYVAGSALGDGGQSEDQKPVFKIEDGGTLQNVNLIGENGGAADGVHTYGDAEIDNVHWLDVGEDALTKKEPGDVVLSNSSMANGDDKGIQDNAGGSLKVINSHFENLGKAYRQNGGEDFPASVEFVDSTFSNIKEAIARSDSPQFSGKISGSDWDNVGEVFMAPDSASTSVE